jgi:hypothetical protein
MRRWALAMAIVLARTAGAVDTISWDDAEKHVGEEAVVEGRVLGVHCSPLSCLLAFDPTFNRFTVIIQASSFRTFPPGSLDATFTGRKVHVHGTIRAVEKKPEIEVSSPENLQLVVTDKDRAEEKATAQQDVVDRLDALLDRIDALTQRMVDTQTRLEQIAAAIDQQANQLAALQQSMAPPPGPPEPTWGEPQPRPGYEALRTPKRGMTSGDVARLVGQPLTVEPSTDGYVIWHYGYGRSVTFDGRGRATSLVGFPAP